MVFCLILLSSLDFTLAQVALKIQPVKHYFHFLLGFGSAFGRCTLFHYPTFDKTARLWAISGFYIQHAVIYHNRLGELTSVFPSWQHSYTKFILMCHIPGWYCHPNHQEIDEIFFYFYTVCLFYSWFNLAWTSSPACCWCANEDVKGKFKATVIKIRMVVASGGDGIWRALVRKF